jgi:Flp pilus assembly pilin Flp
MRFSLNRFWTDRRGHDLVEYALMAGLLAMVAGVIMPGFAASIKTIFGQSIARYGARGAKQPGSNRAPVRSY